MMKAKILAQNRDVRLFFVMEL